MVESLINLYFCLFHAHHELEKILKFYLTCFSSASTNWPVLDNTVVTVARDLIKQIVGVIMEGHYCLLLFILFLFCFYIIFGSHRVMLNNIHNMFGGYDMIFGGYTL